MEKNMYPQVEINLQKLKHNVTEIFKRCEEQGIQVAGVIKGANGIPECARQFAEAGCSFIASSRLEQLQGLIEAGIDTPRMMIRVPMLSEVGAVVRLADISLNSEVEVLKALNEEAGKQDKRHEVILMVDLGDLREGFWDQDELTAAACLVEDRLHNLKLAGVATNLGCYGSINATTAKMEELIACAEKIEARIGRELTYIGGGATTSLPRILEKNMPDRINLLRIGEGILLGKDLQDLWGYDMSFLHRDVFTLKAEIIEVKDKPSYPVGEIMFDAFGFRPEYQDRGIRKRALLGMGKVDYAFPDLIYPRAAGVEILGASSDHTIVDIEEAERIFRVGDILEFDLCYATMVYVTNCPSVKIILCQD